MPETSAVDVEAGVVEICRHLLRRDQIELDRGFYELGGDSLTWIHFVVALERRFHVDLSAIELARGSTLRDIAQRLFEHEDARSTTDAMQSEQAQLIEQLRDVSRPRQEVICGVVPPLANRYSYFLRRNRALTKWNISTGFLRAASPFDHELLTAAVRDLVTHHDGLRLQLVDPSVVRQEIVPPDCVEPLVVVDARGLGEAQVRRRAEHAIVEIRAAFSFPGELFKILHLRGDGNTSYVAVVAHHLLVDAFSFRLVLEDLMTLYGQHAMGGSVALAKKTTSLPDFASASTSYWLSRADEESAYWASLPWHDVRLLEPELDDASPERQAEAHTTYAARTISLEPDRFLRQIAVRTSHRLADLIVAGIARAYRAWTGQSLLCIAMVLHGRESFVDTVDMTRTIGWISETVPLLIRTTLQPDELVEEVRRQLDAATRRGKSFGVLRYLAPGGEPSSPLHELPVPVISLNMKLGALGAPVAGLVRDDTFAPCSDDDPNAERVFLLSGGVYFQPQGLCISWDFSSRLFRTQTVAAFTSHCINEVRAMIGRFAPGVSV